MAQMGKACGMGKEQHSKKSEEPLVVKALKVSKSIVDVVHEGLFASDPTDILTCHPRLTIDMAWLLSSNITSHIFKDSCPYLSP